MHWKNRGNNARKSHDNDSSDNSYETSDSNFRADENFAKICVLFVLCNHCALVLQFCCKGRKG